MADVFSTEDRHIAMPKSIRGAVLLLVAVLAAPGATRGRQVAFLPTRAEASGYAETARYDEAMGLVEFLAAQDPRMHLTTFGYSVEGRALPLVVYGDVPSADAADVRAADRIRVFVQANIHAGEVCGKDAMLALLRNLAVDGRPSWADSVVLLVAPIYNADGNERISLFNRPRQNGPVGGMGRRENAQDLDLNRDHMKLASPEARALVRLLGAYDPHVVVDLHTTNGTQHGYHVTYAAPMHPNTAPGIVRLLRDDWLPTVTHELREAHGWLAFYYGNLPFRGAERGWYTFDHRPRFNNNYVGLRNRVAILSEAYAYAPFRERVVATRAFVESILRYAHARRSSIEGVVEEADADRVAGRPQAVRARIARAARPVDIVLGSTRQVRHPFTGEIMLEMTDERRTESMPEYGTFEAQESVTAPAAYLVPASLRRLRALLDDHGVEVFDVAAAPAGVEAFRIDSTRTAPRAFQGVQEREIFGAWGPAAPVPEGPWIRVPVDQPLGRLVVMLLEPRSDDGAANWGVLDAALGDAEYYPVVREPYSP